MKNQVMKYPIPQWGPNDEKESHLEKESNLLTLIRHFMGTNTSEDYLKKKKNSNEEASASFVEW